VADYSAALLRALRPLGEVEVNAPDAGVHLYHLGNNRLHAKIYQRALAVPGVAVLHDAVLHHFLLGTLSEREYVEEFVYNYGAWSEDQARRLWRNRARSAADPQYFRYPLLKRVVERSRAVVVHNPAAAQMVRDHVPGAMIHEIPMLFETPGETPTPAELMRLRQRMGIASRTFVFGVFGHLRESKRLMSVLRAFEQVRRTLPIALVVAGDFGSSDLSRAVAPFLGPDRGIHRIGFTDEPEFALYTAAVDACINLRYPAAGETSAISIRVMGIGKPVIMTSGLETSRFPEASCLRVDAGVAEEEMLAEYMLLLASSPFDADWIGRRAAAFIGERHAPDRAAHAYWQALTA
jgi:glycosyltransferase involved in cell wall biosynthesis